MALSTSLLTATAALLLSSEPTTAPGYGRERAAEDPQPVTVGSIVRHIDLDLPAGPVDGEVLAYTLDVISRWSKDNPGGSEILADAVATDARTLVALHDLAERLRHAGCWGSAQLCYASGLTLARARGAQGDADRCRKGLALVPEPARQGPTSTWSAGGFLTVAIFAPPHQVVIWN